MNPRRGIPAEEDPNYEEVTERPRVSRSRRALPDDQAPGTNASSAARPTRAARAAPAPEDVYPAGVHGRENRLAAGPSAAPGRSGVVGEQRSEGAAAGVKPATASAGRRSAAAAAGDVSRVGRPGQARSGAGRAPKGSPAVSGDGTGKSAVHGRPGTRPAPTARGNAQHGNKPRTLFGLTLALAWILGLGVGALGAEPAPVPETVPLVTAISRTCPADGDFPGELLVSSSEGQVRSRELGSDQISETDSPLRASEYVTPTVVSPTLPQASVIGGDLVNANDRLWWGTCRAGLADQYVQVPGAAGSRLVIINPEGNDALIDVTLSGPDGEITGDGLRGLTIPADSQHTIDLATYAADADAVGARVRASVGRVVAYAQVDHDAGADFAGRTVQGTQLMISAIPEGSRSLQLLLTNPGTGRNVVQIEAITEAGRVELSGLEPVTVNAQRTTAVDITEAVGGLPMALAITARDPLAASLMAVSESDFGLLPGELDEQSVSYHNLVSVVPGAGVLQIANPGTNEALVVAHWGAGQASSNHTVKPGSIATVEIPEGASSVHVEATAPISGSLLLGDPGGGGGFAFAGLQPAARSLSSMPMEVAPGLGR